MVTAVAQSQNLIRHHHVLEKRISFKPIEYFLLEPRAHDIFHGFWRKASKIRRTQIR